MRLLLILILGLSAEQWVVQSYARQPVQETIMIYYMYHPESDSLWTENTERGRDEALLSDPLVVELDETEYQAKQAELMGR